MSDEWFERLIAAVEAHEDSKRAISLRAGLADTYLFQMVKNRKFPSVANFIAICEAMGVEPAEVLTGVKRDAETRGVLRRFASLTPDQRKAFLAGLASLQPEDDDQPD